MASSLTNLSSHRAPESIDISAKRFSIVVSEYHEQVTAGLLEGCVTTLVKYGAGKDNITQKTVPGGFELTLGAQYEAQKDTVDAVICLGCVIQGETKHFDFICNAIAQGITQVGLTYNKPVIFGVLTPDTWQQALDRSGGKHGNKGDEAALAAIKMIGF